MKALMISLFAMWIGCSPIYAVGNNLSQNAMVATDDDEERDIPLNIIKEDGSLRNCFELIQEKCYRSP